MAAVSHDSCGGCTLGRAEPKNLLRQMFFVQCRSSTGTNPGDDVVVVVVVGGGGRAVSDEGKVMRLSKRKHHCTFQCCKSYRVANQLHKKSA